jgi:hypothetical protein
LELRMPCFAISSRLVEMLRKRQNLFAFLPPEWRAFETLER